jgi:hypothetical protein
MKFFLLISLFISLQAQELFYYQGGKKVSLTPVKKESSLLRSDTTSATHDYYLSNNKNIVGIDNTLLVKTDSIETIITNYPLELIQEISPHIYLLKTTHKSETISLANTLSQDTNVSFAHPNFLHQVKKR